MYRTPAGTMTERYTRDVSSWAARLTGFAMVFALSGASTALSACMAICLQEPSAVAAAHDGAAPVGHVGHASAPRASAASGHAHHAAPASPEPALMAADRTSAPTTPDAYLSALCADCCLGGPFALVASSGAERDAYARGWAEAALQVAALVPAPSAVGASPPIPFVQPPSPARAPLSLRI